MLSQNAIAHLSDSGYLGSGSGIAALESYHAGAIRMLMFMNATQVIDPIDANYATIATVRMTLSQGESGRGDAAITCAVNGATESAVRTAMRSHRILYHGLRPPPSSFWGSVLTVDGGQHAVILSTGWLTGGAMFGEHVVVGRWSCGRKAPKSGTAKSPSGLC